MLRILLCLIITLTVITTSLTVFADPLVIMTAKGQRHNFDVELATTPQERQRGLMYRDYLPPRGGMLFDFETSQPIAMWMANTYISLDMLFIRSDGIIHHIVHQALPQSREAISSRGSVRSVLEITGGLAEQLGIRPGDRVIHSLFSQ